VWCGQAEEERRGRRNGVLTSKEMFWNGVVDLFKRYGRRCEWFAESSSMVVLIIRMLDGEWKNERTNLASYSGPFQITISGSEGGMGIWVGKAQWVGPWVLSNNVPSLYAYPRPAA